MKRKFGELHKNFCEYIQIKFSFWLWTNIKLDVYILLLLFKFVQKNTLILAGSWIKLAATFQLLWVSGNDDFHAVDSFLHELQNYIIITLWENTFALNNDQSCETCTRLHICLGHRVKSKCVKREKKIVYSFLVVA